MKQAEAQRVLGEWGSDDVLWGECVQGDVRLKFFHISPYLNDRRDRLPGRLVYTTEPPFGPSSICRVADGRTWYKVIHRLCDGRRRSVSYTEVLDVAKRYGFGNAGGVHRQLSAIPIDALDTLCASPRGCALLGRLADEMLQAVASFYGIHVEDIRLTGSAGAFRLPLEALDDLDVIVPIKDEMHLQRIASELHPRYAEPVVLGEANATTLNRRWATLR